MDFKKLFRKDDKAVSPVIGVILMVAITVILAAAIGSSVFSHGAAQAAPQASLDIKKDTDSEAAKIAVRIEHLGGDTINLDKDSTRIIISDGTTTKDAIAATTSATSTLSVGDVKVFTFTQDPAPTSGSADIGITDGKTANIKFVDKKSGQIFLDRNVAF
ncbi:type IV pilin N-terminal domain-containing protein [Methanosarcina sp. UBA289]|uniref:type IV pilin N-terminal domain-containing protein n=1 Tax=Methanosarcina sp. UBA289 TaxID=1915574 RepID=UPI0025F6EF73|nr:type IV pilin N-terminal domain-containing protein [Methanosarcina sp. UBA289]